MAAQTEPKWEGKFTVELKGPTVDQVWPIVEDFCNLHKWFPNLDVCDQVEGEEGKPGLIRYCASVSPPSCDRPGGCTIYWAKEKLVMINPVERCLSYEITENNMGFKAYLATWKVLPVNGDDQRGCKIEWSFIGDPIQGWRLEDFNSHGNSSLQYMAKKIEETVVAG